MLCFSVTQICYFLRLYLSHGSKRARRAHLTVRCIAVLAALALTVLVLGEGADVLSLVSLFYYSNLILNLAVAVLQIRRSPLFPSALLLFLLCDTVIGLQVMADSYIPSFTESALYPLLYPDFNLAWAFYLPSQALIPLSLLTERKVAKSSGGTSSKTEVAELRLVKVV